MGADHICHFFRVVLMWLRKRLMLMHRFVYALLFVLLATTSIGALSGSRFFPCSDRLCGQIVWFRWPNDAQGLPLVDLKNRDPELRSRPLLGLTVLRGLRRTGENRWTDGKIYNPDDGVEHQAQMSIQDSTLRVRAYVLLPAFGKTLIWPRVR